MEPTYFTCTLGQAAALGNQQTHKTVDAFVEAQAKSIPDQPAVGFPAPVGKDPRGDWSYKIYTFSEIFYGVSNVANLLLSDNRDALSKRSTVALLCPSTPDFLFTWLALMKLGHSALLIAPQCQPAAIQSLCEQCEVDLLLYDDVYAEQAREAASLTTQSGNRSLIAKSLPFNESSSVADLAARRPSFVPSPQPPVHEDDVAYLHHTSGTSSGTPKPIPQPHRAGVGVLPSFASGKDNATFTTTPLYHGGIADLFRAWTSGALIWLFPGKSVPITATNVVKCLDIASAASEKDSSIPLVKYFSSVPYVLQMLEADTSGLKYLQSMSIVGVGGAALPDEIGAKLVRNGVNLISRFGSAECGFLLSSHREYTEDKEWQYLRSPADAPYVRFEKRDGNLGELVVLKGWPHMAKRNRDDGSYATSDLFEPHSSIPNAWKYHSRADSQLTLITGKKFDPAPLEASIATSDVVEDALIFGNGKPYPGVLLFRSEKAAGMRDADLGREIWPAMQKLNQESQDHARISRDLLVFMPKLEQPLEKSSKGTILRGAAEKRFAKEIEDAYGEAEGGDRTDVKDEELGNAVKSIVTTVAPRKAALDDDTDLFSYGIDSVAGMQIRGRLRQLLPSDKRDLPITVVEDYGTVAGLADYVLKRRHGQAVGKDKNADDELVLMRQLVDEYSNFQPSSSANEAPSTNGEQDDSREVIVLTGATGALGAHVLDQYRSSNTVRKIYCLVRGADAHAAKKRVEKALAQRKLRPLSDDTENKVTILSSHLADPHLGLDDATYNTLAHSVTTIQHIAWSVNFRMKLRSFAKDSIGGLSHLITLALSSPPSRPAPRIAFCSSVASVMAYPSSPIPEHLLDDPSVATELGYSRSKWVAEQICANAAAKCNLRVAIFRVGQLAGDTRTGVWNAKEAWPLMLGSVRETGALPELRDESLGWLPVDTAARALIEGAQSTNEHVQGGGTVEVYHVVNPHTEPKWADLLSWLGKREKFARVSPGEWVGRLERLDSRHPALQLLEHWKRAYAGSDSETGGQKGRDDVVETADQNAFAIERTRECIPVLRTVEPVSEAYFWRLWEWIVAEGL